MNNNNIIEKNQEQLWIKLRKFQVFMQIAVVLVVLWLWLNLIDNMAELNINTSYILFGIVVIIWNFAFFYKPSGLYAKKIKKILQICLFGIAFLGKILLLFYLSIFMQFLIESHLLSWLIALIIWVIFLPPTLSILILSESQIPLAIKKKRLIIYNFAINLILSIVSILLITLTGENGGLSHDFKIMILYLGLMASYFFLLTAIVLRHNLKSHQE